jgi:hypothetical protein
VKREQRGEEGAAGWRGSSKRRGSSRVEREQQGGEGAAGWRGSSGVEREQQGGEGAAGWRGSSRVEREQAREHSGCRSKHGGGVEGTAEEEKEELQRREKQKA